MFTSLGLFWGRGTVEHKLTIEFRDINEGIPMSVVYFNLQRGMNFLRFTA